MVQKGCSQRYSMLTAKMWDGYHVNTVSVDDEKFIVCEYWNGSIDSNNYHRPARSFKLYPEVTKVDIKMNLFGSKKRWYSEISI